MPETNATTDRLYRSSVASPLAPFPTDWSTALAVVAHPDDLEYGAASAVAAWTAAGRTVSYLLVTRGEAGIDAMTPEEAGPVRMAEEIAGAAEVGVSTVEFLDHRDGTIVYSVELRRDIASAIRRHRPELLVIINHRPTWGPGMRNQADHVATGQSALDAVPDAANRWIHRELLDEGLEPWNGVRWIAVSGSPEATHAVDIGTTIDRGIASLRAHRAYLDGLEPSAMSDPEPFLRTMAEAAGVAAGVELAATFELLAC